MRGAHAPGSIAVEVFVKGYVVLEVLIRLEARVERVYLAKALVVVEKNPPQAMRKFRRYLIDGKVGARARGTLDLEIVTVIVVEFLQRLNDEEIDGKPDGAAPVGVAAKQAGAGLGRLVVQGKRFSMRPK